MSLREEIVSYSKGNARNKIVFSKMCIDGLDYIDIGYEISSILSGNSESFSGKETVYEQVMGVSFFNETIGRYLAIKNIGILFEPDLHINLHTILDIYSKGQVLIISDNFSVKNNIFRYYDRGDFSIDLKVFLYKLI